MATPANETMERSNAVADAATDQAKDGAKSAAMWRLYRARMCMLRLLRGNELFHGLPEGMEVLRSGR